MKRFETQNAEDIIDRTCDQWGSLNKERYESFFENHDYSVGLNTDILQPEKRSRETAYNPVRRAQAWTLGGDIKARKIMLNCDEKFKKKQKNAERMFFSKNIR